MIKSKKIILFYNYFRNGGGVTFAKKFIEIFNDYEVYLCVLSRKKSLNLHLDNFPIIRIYKLIFFNGIIIHNSQLTLFFAVFFFHAKNVFISHGIFSNYQYFSKVRKIIFKFQLRFLPIKKIVCCSLDELNCAKLFFKIDDKYTYIYNYVEKKKNYLPKKIKLNNHKKKLLFLGRVCYQKGVDILIEALKILNFKYHKNLTLDIYGYLDDKDNNYVKTINDDILKYSFLNYKGVLNDNIDKDSYIAAIFPSRFEGHPFTPLELSLLDIPIVLSNCYGHNDIIPDNSVGFKFNKDDVNDLILTLLKFLDEDTSKINLRISKLNKRILEIFNKQNFLDGYRKIFNEIN